MLNHSGLALDQLTAIGFGTAETCLLILITCTVTVSASLKEMKVAVTLRSGEKKEAHFLPFPLLNITAEVNALHQIVNDGATCD